MHRILFPVLAALLLATSLLASPAHAADAPARPLPTVSELATRLGTPVTPGALDAVLADLDIAEPEVAVRVARALGRTGGREAAAGLAGLAGHADVAVRVAALQAAGRIGLRHDALCRAARASLASLRESERRAAAVALGRIGDGRDVPRLLERLDLAGETAPVRTAIHHALATLGGVAHHEDLERWKAWWHALKTRDRPQVAQALAQLADPEAAQHAELFRGALLRLGWLDVEAVQTTAKSWLGQSEPGLRREACRLVQALRLADLGPAVYSARCFDLQRVYRPDADATLRLLGMFPEPCLAPDAEEEADGPSLTQRQR